MLHAVGERKLQQEKIHGKQTAEQVVQEWNRNLVISSGETINLGYMRSALNVWDNLMCRPALRALLIEALVRIVILLHALSTKRLLIDSA